MGEAKAKQNCSPSSSLPTSSQQVLAYLQPRQISNITSTGYCLVISYGSGARLVDGFSFLAVLLRQYKNFGKVLVVSLCCDRKSALCISRVKFSHLPFRKDLGPSLITPDHTTCLSSSAMTSTYRKHGSLTTTCTCFQECSDEKGQGTNKRQQEKPDTSSMHAFPTKHLQPGTAGAAQSHAPNLPWLLWGLASPSPAA